MIRAIQDVYVTTDVAISRFLDTTKEKVLNILSFGDLLGKGSNVADTVREKLGPRIISFHTSGKPVIDISITRTGKLSFHPKNGHFKISPEMISFGKRNYKSRSVSIDLSDL